MPVTVREDPREFGHFGDVGLAVERGLRGVEAEGEVVEGDVADVLGEDLPGRARGDGLVLGGEVAIRVPRRPQRGQGVVIGDEVEAVALLLQLDVLLDRAEVVADVQLPGRLDAAQDAGSTRHDWLPGLFFRTGHG